MEKSACESLGRVTPLLKKPVPQIYAFIPFQFVDFFKTKISRKTSAVEAIFYVLNTNGCSNLNLIHFSLQRGPKDIPEQFPHLFDGKMGCIKNCKVTLHIDRSITPVAQTHRRIPFHVRKDVEKELERLENLT